MMKKTKLAIAISLLSVGGMISVAAARDDRGGRPGPGMHHKHFGEQFDTNKDGKLDDAEREAMMDQKVTEHFKQLDTDGNGAVTLAEFKAGMKLRHKHGMMGPPGGFSGRGPGHGPPPGGDVMIHVFDDDGDEVE